MRGKGSLVDYRLFSLRITPADAGKRLRPAGAARSKGDHPRRCGEKPLSRFDADPFLGSPPQMRGKVYAQSLASNVFGITPADAGKSWIKKHWEVLS